MRHRHMYRHLDDDGEHRTGDRLTVRMTTREVAEQIEAMNYGLHRFLSHIVDVRRERLAAKIAKYREQGSGDVAAYVEREGDQLADAIEALLEKGLY
jgi:hypothetical protein